MNNIDDDVLTSEVVEDVYESVEAAEQATAPASSDVDGTGIVALIWVTSIILGLLLWNSFSRKWDV